MSLLRSEATLTQTPFMSLLKYSSEMIFKRRQTAVLLTNVLFHQCIHVDIVLEGKGEGVQKVSPSQFSPTTSIGSIFSSHEFVSMPASVCCCWQCTTICTCNDRGGHNVSLTLSGRTYYSTHFFSILCNS